MREGKPRIHPNEPSNHCLLGENKSLLVAERAKKKKPTVGFKSVSEIELAQLRFAPNCSLFNTERPLRAGQKAEPSLCAVE
jgi:hypothetical protein